jgi:hypothetical protein
MLLPSGSTRKILDIIISEGQLQNSWEICCACTRFPLKLEDFPEEMNEMFVVVV